MTLPVLQRPLCGPSRRGFTVPEYIMTVALFLIVSGGIMAACVYGGRMCALAQAKLDTTEDIRVLVTDFIHDVRTATDFDIGNGSATSFTPTAAGQPRQGNAIQIYITSGTNNYVRYFLDTNSQSFKAVAPGLTNAIVLATSITNKVPFTCEDTQGNVTTNEQVAEIIGLNLKFNPTIIRTTGQGGTKDYFQVSTRVNKRTTLGFQSQ